MVPRVLLSPPPPPASLFKEYFVSAVLGIKDRALYITGMRFTAKPHPQEGLRSILYALISIRHNQSRYYSGWVLFLRKERTVNQTGLEHLNHPVLMSQMLGFPTPDLGNP